MPGCCDSVPRGFGFPLVKSSFQLVKKFGIFSPFHLISLLFPSGIHVRSIGFLVSCDRSIIFFIMPSYRTSFFGVSQKFYYWCNTLEYILLGFVFIYKLFVNFIFELVAYGRKCCYLPSCALKSPITIFSWYTGMVSRVLSNCS